MGGEISVGGGQTAPALVGARFEGRCKKETQVSLVLLLFFACLLTLSCIYTYLLQQSPVETAWRVVGERVLDHPVSIQTRTREKQKKRLTFAQERSVCWLSFSLAAHGDSESKVGTHRGLTQ